jgi:AcrR family transcriptional regulator
MRGHAKTPSLPPAPRRRGREQATTGRQPRWLNREVIAEVALGVVDTDGLDGLTMRRVADELGTGPASLYAHIADKNEMIEAALDLAIGEVPVPEVFDPDRWADQLKEIARHTREVYGRHGDLARAGMGNIPTGPNALRITEALLALLRAGGISDRVAALSTDMIGLYITAVAFEEGIEANVGVKVDHDQAFHERLQKFWMSLPPDQYPNLVAMAIPLTAGDGNERFEFGLDLIVRGIASTAIEPGLPSI